MLLGALIPGGMAAPAAAGPVNGLGAMGGLAAHSFRLPQDVGDDLIFSGYGPSVWLDAQFVVNDRWSLVPVLQASLEHTTDMFHVPGNTEGTVFTYSALFQVRFWLGDYYLSPHIGVYQEAFSSYKGQLFQYGSEGGGASVGWEGGEGWIANAAVDWETPLVNHQIWALRAQVGYRWR